MNKTWKLSTEKSTSVLSDDFMRRLKESLVEQGWTVKHSGVIYDHDPGDEHVEPSRWYRAEPTRFIGGQPVSWTLKNPEGDIQIDYAEPVPGAKL
jgi:hypothetical protein